MPPSLLTSMPQWQKMKIPVNVIFIMFYVLIINDIKVLAQEENLEQAVLKEVNELRAKGCTCGEEKMPPAGPVTWNKLLENAAVKHVYDMVDNRNFSHTGSDGSSVSDRVNQTGYKWSMLGENIAFGYHDATGAIQGWAESEWHCRNMMNPVFKEIGVARKGDYWVMDLGSPK